MKAAVVTTYGEAPRYQEFPAPTPADRETLVRVVAAGLHPRVRSQAAGSHYTSTDELPLVPGIDGVGRTSRGELRYFVLPDTAMGAMAERTVVDVRRSIALPPDSDPVQVAAAMNPAMSSWLALRCRLVGDAGSGGRFRRGDAAAAMPERLMVLGATGNAGRMAVQVAKHLGVRHVSAVGRDPERLAEVASLGADRTVQVEDTDALGDAGRDIDVVLDYVWGTPTADAMRAIIPRRANDEQRLTWVQIGSMGGLEAPIPSAALRAVRLEIIGSGQGSVPPKQILAELPQLVAEINKGTFSVGARAVPLSDVEQAWADAATSRDRLVIVPG